MIKNIKKENLKDLFSEKIKDYGVEFLKKLSSQITDLKKKIFYLNTKDILSPAKSVVDDLIKEKSNIKPEFIVDKKYVESNMNTNNGKK